MTHNIDENRTRRDYKLTTEEVGELTKASHSFEEKHMAVQLTREVWKRIADKRNIEVNSIKDSIRPEHKGDPKWFSAIPRKDDEEE